MVVEIGEIHEEEDAFLEPRPVAATGHKAPSRPWDRAASGSSCTHDIEQERDEENAKPICVPPRMSLACHGGRP